jgi:hypothetical protein
MSSDRDQSDYDDNRPSWMTAAVMFAVIGSTVSFAAMLMAIDLLRQ